MYSGDFCVLNGMTPSVASVQGALHSIHSAEHADRASCVV